MYDRPYRTRHSFNITLDGSTFTRAIPVPRGKSGRVWDYGVEGVTVTLTSACDIMVGTAADPDAYAEEFELDGAAGSKSVRQTHWPVDANSTTDLRDFLVGESTAIQGSTGAVIMTVIGSSDGAGDFFVEMEWND